MKRSINLLSAIYAVSAYFEHLSGPSLKFFLETGTPKLPLNAGNISNLSKKLKTPLLIWVDDDPKNNAFKVDFAQRMGINVIQLTSTAIAKAWIAENAGAHKLSDTGY